MRIKLIIPLVKDELAKNISNLKWVIFSNCSLFFLYVSYFRHLTLAFSFFFLKCLLWFCIYFIFPIQSFYPKLIILSIKMNYSIHSPYPIQSVLPLSDSHFATILPLDNLLQVYSTTSSHPLASLWCSGSIFIDTKINNYYLTHGLYSISLFSDSSNQTIDVED